MAYEEPKDPLTGKSFRHSKTAAISGVLGISKSIIEEEPEPVPEPEPEPVVEMQKNIGEFIDEEIYKLYTGKGWQPLNIIDNSKITFTFKYKTTFDASPDIIKYAWASKRRKTMLWIAEGTILRGNVSSVIYDVNYNNSKGLFGIGSPDKLEKALDIASRYMKEHP